MARKLREKIDAPETLYHVVCRGINRRRIFKAPQDFKKFLTILKKTKDKFNFYLYSYSLLPNHFHLFIQVNKISVSKIMHYLNTCYAIYFNRRYERRGPLFQDRFYSSPVKTEFYFWALGAYIDLNAFRAGLVKNLGDYYWGSYRFYNQKNYKDDLIDRNQFLFLSGQGSIEQLRQNYIEFVKKEAENPKRPKFVKSEKFI